MSRRSNRPRRSPRIEKAQIPGLGTGASTYTTAQVQAMLQAVNAMPSTTGGFNPLPRLDPQVAFGPGLPLIPAAIDPVRPDSGRPEPRFNEYPVSTNQPGVTDRLVPWKVLRDAAAAGGIPRRCIEIRKSEISTLDWAITLSKGAVEQAQAEQPGASRADVEADLRKRLGPEIARCSTFWERPDPGQDEDWIEWITKLLEEHYVLDAIALYPRLTYGGDLCALEIIAGDTIKVLRDYRGGRPGGGQPAYQQILWGFPRGEYTADVDEDGKIHDGYTPDTLIYKRRNVRAETPYGFSAVEQSLEDLDVWLRRRSWIRAEFTEGTVPTGFLRNTADNSWTPAQVLEYETALNDAWGGQILERHRMRILPPGFELETQPDVAERYKPEYDLFLLKQLANHFNTTIAELNFTDGGGLGSSGYHEGQSDIRARTATMPMYRWIQALITQISRRHLKMPPELEFKILGLEDEDEAAADAVASEQVGDGRMTYNEDRDRRGLPRYTFPEADMPIVKTGRGMIFLEGSSSMAPPGETVTPVEAPGNTDANGDGVADRFESEDAAEGDTDPQAVKAEIAAFRRWARRNPAPVRPFRAELLTKSTAPVDIASDPRIVFAAPGGDADPKAADQPDRWPGWDRDLSTADIWASRITTAMSGAVDARFIAGHWLAEQLVKSDPGDTLVVDADDYWTTSDSGSTEPWAVAAALAFLHRHNVTVIPALAFLRLVWLEGYAIGHASATALLDGRDHIDAWGWAEGDAKEAEKTLTPEQRGAFDRWSQTASAWVAVIGANRLNAVARTLVRGRNQTAAELSASIATVLASAPWALGVAVTELTRASGQAAIDAYRAAGVGFLRWVTEKDILVCPTCVGNAAAGPVAIGGLWPDGSGSPPGHPRCRCSLAPA